MAKKSKAKKKSGKKKKAAPAKKKKMLKASKKKTAKKAAKKVAKKPAKKVAKKAGEEGGSKPARSPRPLRCLSPHRRRHGLRRARIRELSVAAASQPLRRGRLKAQVVGRLELPRRIASAQRAQ